jgi:hypothetical protein
VPGGVAKRERNSSVRVTAFSLRPWRLGVNLSLAQLNREFLKVQRYRLKHILAEFFPSLRFREDGVAKRTSTIATFVIRSQSPRISFPKFEDNAIANETWLPRSH